MDNGTLQDPRDGRFLGLHEPLTAGVSTGAAGRDRQAGGPAHERTRPIGLFKGVGPRGYRRSDVSIIEDVNDFLTVDEELDASSIEVAVDNGIVTLKGVVRSRYDKKLAGTIADGVRGVKDVMNELRIRNG